MSAPSPRLLVIEDDASVAELMRIVLAGAGYDVDVAHDGQAGFQQATRAEYDLVLCDLMMPRWNGETAIASLAMVRPELRILVVSALHNATAKARIQAQPNVRGWVQKPFLHHQLLAAVAAARGS